MKSKPIVLFAGACIAGLALGYGAKRFSGTNAPPPIAENAATKSSRDANAKGGEAGAPGDLATLIPSVATTRSTETLESLKADSTDLYARLALWMVDASQEDVKAFWEYYRTQKNRSNDINDVIFINWARIDPLAASAAAKGTPDEHYAWWAWACHDPQAALDAAIATNPDRINNVTWGIGEFHPDWTMKHFDELPEDSRDNALRGLAKWDDREHPQEILDFLIAKGNGYHAGLFKVLSVRDPWGAYDWLEKNKNVTNDEFDNSGSLMGSFVNSLALYHPDVLDRIADNTPSGQLKRAMENKAFQGLLKTDLDAAIQQAEETKGSAVAGSRLTAVALAVARTDPDRAFSLAKKLFEVCPNPWEEGLTVMTASGGSTRWGGDNSEVDTLLATLMDKDPRRAMELAVGLPTESSDPFGATGVLAQHAGILWANRDPEGFGDWIESQPTPEKRAQGTQMMIGYLMSEQDYAGAADWAGSMSEGDSGNSMLISVVANWTSNDMEAARAWFEKAQLSEEERRNLQGYFPDPKR